MQFQLMSDVHLEFCDHKLPGGDILLLAGDIVVADYLRTERTDSRANDLRETAKKFFREECAKYNKVYYITGNHEHYSGYFEDTNHILESFLAGTNVQFLDKENVDLGDGVVLWGACLWTDYDKGNYFALNEARRSMNDFSHIKRHGLVNYAWNGSSTKNLTPEETAVDNTQARESLMKCLADNVDKKVIVMSHHGPSMKSCHPRFGGTESALNYAYNNTGLEKIMLDNPQLKVWVHGHTHDTHDYMIGETRVICNPRGYARPQSPNFPENKKFDNNLIFEV
jgi:Icc-related predicted phosphoesterase